MSAPQPEPRRKAHPALIPGLIAIATAAAIGLLGPVVVLAAYGALCIIGLLVLASLLYRDRGATWQPGDGNPEDEPDATSAPVRPASHILAATPDDGYEVTSP